MMAIILGFIILVGTDSRPSLRDLCLRWNWQASHKSFCTEFFDVFAYHPIIEADLFGDVENRMLAFESHHNFFDGTVERPVLPPIHPQTVATEKDRAAEVTFRNVIA